MWTHKEVDLAPHPVVGLVFQVRETEKFARAFCFESLGPFFRVSEQGPSFTAFDEDGDGNRLIKFELTGSNKSSKKKKKKKKEKRRVFCLVKP